MLTPRQLLILEAIIRDYTNIGQPVGSKKLQEQLPVHVSSATIRNEMAALEQAGYIAKEHSSSGRIPSLLGYRYYVDNLVRPAKLNQQERLNIKSSFANEFSRVDEIVATSAKILSELTNYTAISLKPGSEELRLEGFRMVPLGSQQVMLLMVTSDGAVENQIFNLPPEVTGAELEAVIRVINERLVGLPLSQISGQLQNNMPLLSKYLHQPAGFLDVFGDVLSKAVREHVYVGGKKNLLNLLNSDNLEQVKLLYSLFDRQSDLNQLLYHDNNDISIKIGSELSNDILLDYSVITAKYNDGNNGQGLIAILGPTNMPYSKMIGLLDAFRNELSNRLIDYYNSF